MHLFLLHKHQNNLLPRVNLKVVEENLKQKLCKMNIDEELEEKNISSPLTNIQLKKALLKKFDLKLNDNNSINLDNNEVKKKSFHPLKQLDFKKYLLNTNNKSNSSNDTINLKNSKILLGNKFRALKRIKKVYDSMVDNETDEDIKDEGVINPESQFILFYYYDIEISKFKIFMFLQGNNKF